MKTMTCEQLGGACTLEFQANTFEEIATMSRKHGMEMFKNSDSDHLEAMEDMKGLMESPTDMAEWLESKKNEFENLPED